MADVEHKDLTAASGNMHEVGFHDQGDPGLGAGAGRVWVQKVTINSVDYFLLNVRNLTNSGWNITNALLSDGVTNVTVGQVNTHLSDATRHRIINDAGVGATDLFSAQKVLSLLAPVTTHMNNASIHRSINDSGSGATDLWSGQKIAAQLAAKQANVAAGQLVPVGTILANAGNSTPSGYLFCDGSAQNIATYPALAALIGALWGTTGGSFWLPDLRGYFLRGANQGSANDPDVATRTRRQYASGDLNLPGSLQDSQFGSHRHGIGNWFGWNTWEGSTAYWTAPENWTKTQVPVGDRMSAYVGGNETRPKNAAVNFYIKY